MKTKDQVLKQVYESIELFYQDDNKTFGKKNKPRNEEPTMFDIMKWPRQQDEPWDFKKKIQVEKEPETKKVTARINHENQHWQTENKDNFRKIEKLKVDDSQIYVQKLDEKTIKNIAKSCECQNSKAQQANQPQQYQQQEDLDNQYKLPLKWNPKQQSAYRDNYQVKDIKDQNELIYQLEQNNQNFKGQYKVVHPQGGFYYEESKKEEEDVVSSEEEDEEVNDQQNDDQVKKMTTKFIKKAKTLDPNNPEDAEKLKRRQERIKKFNGETRWIADSAFTTYFGKPAWGPYGYNNVNPTVGGVIYGQHLLSHNVQPHRNRNDPYYIQTYQNALRKGAAVANVEPEPPRNCREEDRLNPEQVEALKSRNPLTPQPYQDLKKQLDSKGKQVIPEFSIKKPDLSNTLRFASEAGSVQGEQLQQENKKSQQKIKRPQSALDNRTQKSQNENKSKISNDQKTKDSKKKLDKKVQMQSESNLKVDDQLAIPDKASNKFIEELKQKKEKANRLTCKVNEINPSLLKKSPRQEQKNQITADLQEVKSFDDKNPPPNYLQSLDPIELNPKNYKGVPSDWLHRIPFAGKKQEIIKNGQQTKECFDYGF
ncbi:unnamed protein product (macronuclear) [Paramecium tetraurelia]|uniref:Uncharacterized protein n=1 Tax=Paramecium tetraurelia TaxID=5888 RepID=A0EFP3_PARTE|nr:uncharacterized protein GSPATT00026457001 [Paramecium tetraurelia]CAK94134.1 unnamed protein product [Paramecium tetraurelia]|eukprot:XP_001461507.1 hypothetical protein (macronuclear) [Paramecium tetraurelia strain d4-2]